MRENDLLQHIYSFNAELGARISIPPGDDMGAIRLGDRDVLITVDQLVDGVHFRLDETSLAKIARKAITRSLSDVAAMAAKPIGAVVAGCLPSSFGEAKANALFDAMRHAAATFNCPLVGGDIAMWDQGMVLTVTVLAEADGVEPVRRTGAKIGDAIFVTGKLGGTIESVGSPPYVHHLDFEPRIAVARSLASSETTRPRCMMDVSDGIATDLPRLVEAADESVSAIIDTASLPLSDACLQASKKSGRPAWQHAMSDGEDYELCMIVDAETAERLPANVEGVSITRIGNIVQREQSDVLLRQEDGTVDICNLAGWEHQD